MRRLHPQAPKPRWILKPQPSAAALRVLGNYPPQLATLLWQRGLKTQKTASVFLNPHFTRRADPRVLKDMEKAVERLARAQKHHERVFVAGDLDHDGICGAVLLSVFFKDMGLAHEAYMPSEEEGHELSYVAVERAEKFGATLLITVDFGVSSKSAIAWARRKGMDVIILDHHMLPQDLPEAYAIIDPRYLGTPTPLSYLCGAGVAFAFVDACARGGILPQKIRDQNSYLRSFLDLVAMATIGDLVPLQGDNRSFVREGLTVLGERKRIGVAALCGIARLKEVVGEDDVAFLLVPPLNAARRLGNASLAYDLLRVRTVKSAEKLARSIGRANAARQTAAKRFIKEAMVKIERENEIPWVIIIGDASWPMSYLSILASRIKDRYHRPVFVWSRHPEGFLRISSRSIPAFDLVDAMQKCGGGDFFKKYGGHPQAAGGDFEANKFVEFERRMIAHAKTLLSPENLMPTIEIDLELKGHELGPELSKSFEPLAPFGKENPRPRVAVRQLRVISVGKPTKGWFGKISVVPENGGRLITVFAEQDNPAFNFRQGDIIDMVIEYSRLFGMSADKTALAILVDAHLH